jgi:hypothetical protein
VGPCIIGLLGYARMVEWIKTVDRLPDSWDKKEPCAPYYTVQVNGFGNMRAMFLDGEWWVNYCAKIMEPVGCWLDN